ncbi:chlorohydrolase [Streptococcus pneumoniae]|uniref:hypothetical protein n=1 Tax=Streptococcus pneumoniae TaxID=1313 RepID=UPI0005E12265|nr:hypothetical protein [Streptococcus pneumoniae]CEZ48954.1 chlorohydrolase [Streptococcus pneumoniae]
MKLTKSADRTDEVSSKHRFEVADRTDEVSSKHRFEVADRTDDGLRQIELTKSAQNTVLRWQIELTMVCCG